MPFPPSVRGCTAPKAVMLVVALAVCAFPASMTHAQRASRAEQSMLENVTLRVLNTETTRGYVEYTGTILKYDRVGVEFFSTDKQKTTIPPERILSLRYPRTPAEELAEMLQIKGQHAEALKGFLNVRRTEHRPLASLFLQEKIIQCCRVMGNHRDAIDQFLNMSGRAAKMSMQMPDQMFSCIPLAWKSSMADSVIVAKMSEIDKSDRTPVSQLIAAGYMLSTARRNEGIGILKTLAKNKDPRIATLAEMLLWRTVQRKDVTLKTLATWERTLEKVPLSMRGGPSYILAEKYAMLEQYDLAALAFLKSATVYHQSDDFSADAMYQAAMVMQRSPHPGDADVILKEIIRKFPRTDVARRANRQASEGTKN